MKHQGVKGLRQGLLACCAVLLLTAGSAAAQEKFTDSNEFKDEKFHKGCIGDYQELLEADGINWAWIAPGVKLGEYKVTVGKISNLTDVLVKAQVEEVSGFFRDYFGKLAGEKGTLKAEVCFHEAESFSAAKAWIPFAGGHAMQAGFGAEVILTGSNGKPVAKLRHFAREGMRIEEAGRQTADDLRNFIAGN